MHDSYGTDGQATYHNIIGCMAVTVQKTGHRSPYSKVHGSYGTDGQTTDHNIIQRMAIMVQTDMPQIKT